MMELISSVVLMSIVIYIYNYERNKEKGKMPFSKKLK